MTLPHGPTSNRTRTISSDRNEWSCISFSAASAKAWLTRVPGIALTQRSSETKRVPSSETSSSGVVATAIIGGEQSGSSSERFALGQDAMMRHQRALHSALIAETRIERFADTCGSVDDHFLGAGRLHQGKTKRASHCIVVELQRFPQAAAALKYPKTWLDSIVGSPSPKNGLSDAARRD